MSSFETTLFRDGAWRTERVQIQPFLKEVAPAAQKEAPPKSPSCGVLTRTLVESPVTHWILPARLRSVRQNDVAFIGDHHVQINELRDGGELHPVLRKKDFGSRIRNACVIGSTSMHGEGIEDEFGLRHLKQEDSDVDMAGTHDSEADATRATLPPQLLLLILDSGLFIFMFIRRHADGLEFVTSTYHHQTKALGDLGFHVTVDPKSHYLAVGDVHNKFVVYELESWETLRLQYQQGEEISPLKDIYSRPIQGVLHDLVFLHPRPQDDYHVILLLIVVRSQSTSMILYDWEQGDDLRQVLAERKPSHRLPAEHTVPLFIVPLTTRSSFLLVSEDSMGLCKDPLQGPPTFEKVNCEAPPPTEYYHGQTSPLWVAWDRPVRRQEYYAENDNIYLAREDGAIVFLECNLNDVTGATMNVGNSDCTISRAFTTMYDTFNDVAIMGGEAGFGAICQLRPRELLVELGTVPNWSPVLDFVTSDPNVSWNPDPFNRAQRHASVLSGSKTRDRMFCISGRGKQGSVTEIRYGIVANIGWEIPYDSHVQRAWVFEANLPGVGPVHLLLLTLPEATDVLQVVQGSLEISRVDSEELRFDIASRTLAAGLSSDDSIIQVTESSVTLVSPSHRQVLASITFPVRFADRHNSMTHALDTLHGALGKAAQAATRGDYVAVSVYNGTNCQVHIHKAFGMDVSLVQTLDVSGEVTALAFCSVGHFDQLLIGVWCKEQPRLAVHPLSTGHAHEPLSVSLDCDKTVSLSPASAAVPATIDSFATGLVTSIVVVEEGNSETTVALGSRNGYLVSVKLRGDESLVATASRDRLGSAALDVMEVSDPLLPKSVMVCCDDNLLLLRGPEKRRIERFKSKQRIFPNDVKNPAMAAPTIHFATTFKHSIGQTDHVSLLVLSGDRILVCDMLPRAGLVPRSLPLNGTPTKMLYSDKLKCLVVAMITVSGETDIAFIDVETGERLPSFREDAPDKNRIKGLGDRAGRINDLAEWPYSKQGKLWLFLIVTTRDGQMLIVSTSRMQVADASGRPTIQIQHGLRNKRNAMQPVYAAVGDGEDLFYCAGKDLRWEALDLTSKKFQLKKTLELDSPATSLRVVEGKIHALTAQNSLLIIDKTGPNPDEMSIIHSDQINRTSQHYIDVGCEDESPWPVSIICDRTHNFAGVWVPWQEPNKNFENVFQGSLPSVIRRLRRGFVRPPWRWSDAGTKFGHIPSTVDGADVLGMALDGSLYHFALLSPEAWAVLRLIQRLASATALICPLADMLPAITAEDMEDEEVTPRKRHIDGDVLARCLEKRALAPVIAGTPGADALLRQRLDLLDGGVWTAAFREGQDEDKYLELAYDILEYYLAPIL